MILRELQAVSIGIGRAAFSPDQFHSIRISDKEATNSHMTPAPGQQVTERRSDRRYPVNGVLEYRAVLRDRMMVAGVGRIIDMSCGGILFQAASPLPIDHKVDISIFWPAHFGCLTPLKLQISGRTVRADGNRTAITIDRYEFHTPQSDTPDPSGRIGAAERG